MEDKASYILGLVEEVASYKLEQVEEVASCILALGEDWGW